jgi:formylglycine-generating enzyme required for sulfatase activity
MKQYSFFTRLLAALALTVLVSLSGCVLAGLGSLHSEKPKPPPKTVIVNLGENVTMEFVLMPAGTFTMGSDANPQEQPTHLVTFDQPFYMARHLVTQVQWQRVMDSEPGLSRDFERPKTGITWYDCQRFITKLTRQVPGQQFCLPSEAQWEYACRAGDSNDYSFTDGIVDLTRYGWYDANSGGVTHPVGLKRGNAWGLYDMHGNAWEWCQDLAHDTYNGAPVDGSAWIVGTNDTVSDYFRIIRGGSALDDAAHLRSSQRRYLLPDHADSFIGLRVAVTLPDKEKKKKKPDQPEE